MTEKDLIPEVRRLLETFDTKQWSPELIPGHTPTVERDLSAAVERTAAMTDEEFRTALLSDPETGKALENGAVEEEINRLFRLYAREANRTEYSETRASQRAGELMEEVLSALNLTEVI